MELFKEKVLLIFFLIFRKQSQKVRDQINSIKLILIIHKALESLKRENLFYLI